MRRLFRHLALIVLVFAAVLVALGFLAGRASAQGAADDRGLGGHGVGHAQMHDTYKNWSPPGNPHASCCNDDDCRPTRAYVDDEGAWRAWNGVLWLVIPAERVLPTDHAHDGRSHLCEKGGHVYCFTPAPPRS